MKVQGRPAAASSTATSTGAGAQAYFPKRLEPHPLSVLLFGKRPPKLVDKRKHPKLKKALRKLEAIKDQVAELAGQSPGELSIELCEGGNASISRQGQISVGVELLERHQGNDDLLVAVLGHEIGHQPWDWPEGDFSKMTKRQMDALYREEEAKADRFAGRILADLGADPDAVCEFLLAAERFEAHKPSDYYPADVRAQMIRQAFSRRRSALARTLSLYPELAARARDLR